jgi:hypothetical protein
MRSLLGWRRLTWNDITSLRAGLCRTAMSSFNGRLRDALLNGTLFMSSDHARVEIAAGVEEYNRETPRSPLG